MVEAVHKDRSETAVTVDVVVEVEVVVVAVVVVVVVGNVSCDDAGGVDTYVQERLDYGGTVYGSLY